MVWKTTKVYISQRHKPGKKKKKLKNGTAGISECPITGSLCCFTTALTGKKKQLRSSGHGTAGISKGRSVQPLPYA